jgi:hypothetical protein
MAGTLPQIGQGLGAIHSFINRMGAHSLNPYAHTPHRKILLCLMNF